MSSKDASLDDSVNSKRWLLQWLPFVYSIYSGWLWDKCWRGRLLLWLPLFWCLQTFFCQPCWIFYKTDHRRDRITYSTLISPPSLMQQKHVTAKLSQTSFCSHSKLACLLVLPSQLRRRWWPLWVKYRQISAACARVKVLISTPLPSLASPLLFPWHSIKYRCLLAYALLCRGWDNVVYFP